MMKFTVLCVLAVAGLAASRPEDKYTDRFDNINVKQVLDNPRLVKGYVDCIIDVGKCTPEGKELKSHIVDALENNCAKCTEVQLESSRMVFSHLINFKPEVWNQLKAKYDPQGKYVHKYEKELKTIVKE